MRVEGFDGFVGIKGGFHALLVGFEVACSDVAVLGVEVFDETAGGDVGVSGDAMFQGTSVYVPDGSKEELLEGLVRSLKFLPDVSIFGMDLVGFFDLEFGASWLYNRIRTRVGRQIKSLLEMVLYMAVEIVSGRSPLMPLPRWESTDGALWFSWRWTALIES